MEKDLFLNRTAFELKSFIFPKWLMRNHNNGSSRPNGKLGYHIQQPRRESRRKNSKPFYEVSVRNSNIEVESDVPLENVLEAARLVAGRCEWFPARSRIRVANDFERAEIEETRKYYPEALQEIFAFNRMFERASDSAAKILINEDFPVVIACAGLEKDPQEVVIGKLAHEFNHWRQRKAGYMKDISEAARWAIDSLLVEGFNENHIMSVFCSLKDVSCDLMAIEDFEMEMHAFRMDQMDKVGGAYEKREKSMRTGVEAAVVYHTCARPFAGSSYEPEVRERAEKLLGGLMSLVPQEYRETVARTYSRFGNPPQVGAMKKVYVEVCKALAEG
jgi:hypothetical protein